MKEDSERGMKKQWEEGQNSQRTMNKSMSQSLHLNTHSECKLTERSNLKDTGRITKQGPAMCCLQRLASAFRTHTGPESRDGQRYCQ